ncbi:MAG: metalloregulator ArsR/SmtB family transcription factor [Planctomycetota bacterium]|nr:metalloregulator ArsR/SmtB family transcription factor [Planctomycetota bacterium]
MNQQTLRLYEMKAQIIQAVGQPIRLAILDFLKDGEQCVCDIAKAVGAERSNVSRHLTVLLNAGILECRKDGLKMIYSLRTPCIMNFFSCVADVLKSQLAKNNRVLQKL